MAVAHDAATRFPTGTALDTTTGTRTFQHAANASAKGALVLVCAGNTGSPVTGVLYGGQTMQFLTSAEDTSEPGVVQAFFLGDLTGLGGTQTVTLQGANAESKFATCVTVTASTAVTVVAGSNSINTQTSANPALTFSWAGTHTVQAYGAVHGGQAAPGNYVPAADVTALHGGDYGQKAAQTARGTATDSTSPGSIGFTAGSDDWCMVVVGIREGNPATLDQRVFRWRPSDALALNARWPLRNGFEFPSGDNVQITTGNSGGTGHEAFNAIGGTLAVTDTAEKVHGAQAMYVPSPSAAPGWVSFSARNGASTATWYVVQFYFRISAAPPQEFYLYRGGETTSFNRINIGLDADMKLRLNSWEGNAVIVSNALAVGQWHRVVFAYQPDLASATPDAYLLTFEGANVGGATPSQSLSALTGWGIGSDAATWVHVFGTGGNVTWTGTGTTLWMDSLHVHENDAGLAPSNLAYPYRYEPDEGEDITVNPGPGVKVRLRTRVVETGNDVAYPGSSGYKLYVSKNGGAYAALASGSGDIRLTTSAFAINDAVVSPARLSSGGATLNTGVGVEDGEATAPVTLNPGNYTEHEWVLEVFSGADGDTFDFEIRRSDGTQFATYTDRPRITLDILPAALTQAAFRFRLDDSAALNGPF